MHVIYFGNDIFFQKVTETSSIYRNLECSYLDIELSP